MIEIVMDIKKWRGGKRRSYVAAVVVMLIAYVAWALARPLPALSAQVVLPAQTPAAASKLAWPAQGQSAVGVVGTSILDMHGAETPVPTASTAKLITALVVLQQKPLKAGEQGPMITLNSSDVALYQNYAAQDGSLVKVQAGEQISEYQMLQTMMLPSANNMADSLAIWAFGSLQDYASAANQYLESLGLVTTHVGKDASGLSPTTTSTAHDMVQIGELAMKDPVLSQIVGKSSASGIPVVGNITNVNMLLGTDNIVGIKTGNSDQAGGAFVSASRATVNGKQITVVTALMKSPSLFQAMKDSLPLITSAQTNFSTVTVVRAGTPVGSYKQPWGGTVQAVASKDVSATLWNGSTVTSKVTLRQVKTPTPAGTVVGTVRVPKSFASSPELGSVKLKSTPTNPPITWRLKHPF